MKFSPLLILLSVAFAIPSQAGITFSPPTTYESGVIAKWVGVADFDEDGNPDLIVSQTDSSRVALLLGRGDGTFPSRRLFPLSVVPLTGATGDLNGDGHVDLAVATSTGIDVLLGNGNGTFQPEQFYPCSVEPYAIAVGDLDEDGRPDLIFPDAGHSVHVLWANDQGGFGPESSFVTGIEPVAVVVADLDRDGHLDVATADYGHVVYGWKVSTLRGSGSRSIGPSVDYAAAPEPVSLSVGDLNGDGSLDLIAESELGGRTVLINQGAGTFDASTTGGYSNGEFVTTLADLDDDSAPDFLIAANVGIVLERGLGSGRFATIDTLPMTSLPRMVAAADLDHDSRPDLVAGANGVWIWINQTPVVGIGAPSKGLRFEQPRPNPSRQAISFDYSLPEDREGSLVIFDLRGRVVSTVASGRMAAGPHRTTWNLHSGSGRLAPAGVYFARLSVGNHPPLVRRIEVLP